MLRNTKIRSCGTHSEVKANRYMVLKHNSETCEQLQEKKNANIATTKMTLMLRIIKRYLKFLSHIMKKEATGSRYQC